MSNDKSFPSSNSSISVVKPTVDTRQMFSFQMKQLKTELPKQCTHLAPYENYKGELYVRVIVNGKTSLFTIPDNVAFKKADLEELKAQILIKCEENVSKRD